SVRLGTTVLRAADRVVETDGSAVEGDFVIGADGLRSVVRESLFGPEPPRYGGHRAWRASVEAEHELARDTFVEAWGVGGGAGFGPVGGGRVYWYVFRAQPEAEEPPADPKAEFLRLYGDRLGPIPALIAA